MAVIKNKKGYFTMKKRLLAVLLTALMLVSVSACGDDEKDIESKIENMSDSEIEDAILQGADMLG